mgnify:CR=1 FL=1
MNCDVFFYALDVEGLSSFIILNERSTFGSLFELIYFGTLFETASCCFQLYVISFLAIFFQLALHKSQHFSMFFIHSIIFKNSVVWPWVLCVFSYSEEEQHVSLFCYIFLCSLDLVFYTFGILMLLILT